MKRSLSIAACLAAGTLLALAAPPAWWSEEETKVVDETITGADNYAPANLGQLKHVAKKAKEYLDGNLVGGAGSTINTLVASFEPRAGQGYTQPQIDAFIKENYAPINLGQLKAVSKPFYARLIAAGYDTQANLIARGYDSGWSYDYPWNTATPVAVAENYAPANLGQLKLVFSFDLSALDTDGDGIPNGVEIANGTDPEDDDVNNNGVADGLDDFDGDGITNAQEIADHTNPFDAGSVTGAPSVETDTANANALLVYTPLF